MYERMGFMFTTANILVLLALVFLLPLIVSAIWLQRVQICVAFLWIHALLQRLYIRLVRVDLRLERGIRKTTELLAAKNTELIDVSRKTRELSPLVLRAQSKLTKLKRKLLKKPDDFSLKTRASDQIALANQLQSKSAELKRLALSIRAEIKELEYSRGLKIARLRETIAEKRGYVPAQQRLIYKTDVDIQKALHATERILAQVENKEAGIEDGKVSSLQFRPNGISANIQKQLSTFERTVLRKEVEATEWEANLSDSGLHTAREPSLNFQAYFSVDRVFSITERHINRIFSLFTVADPSIEHAHDRLLQQFYYARRLAAESLEEELVLEERCKRAPAESQFEQLAEAVRAHRVRNILIDQQLFKVDCIIRRIFILKEIIALSPAAREDIFAFKAALKAIIDYLEDGWELEMSADKKDSSGVCDLSARFDLLESKVQMTLIRIAKGDYRKLSQGEVDTIKKNLPDTMLVIDREIAEQGKILSKWKFILAEALKNETKIIHVVAAKRIEQGEEVSESLMRSLEVLKVFSSVWEC